MRDRRGESKRFRKATLKERTRGVRWESGGRKFKINESRLTEESLPVLLHMNGTVIFFLAAVALVRWVARSGDLQNNTARQSELWPEIHRKVNVPNFRSELSSRQRTFSWPMRWSTCVSMVAVCMAGYKMDCNACVHILRSSTWFGLPQKIK